MIGWMSWSNEQFLRYVAAHSQTSRALFSSAMIVKFYELAGKDCASLPDEMITLHYDEARPLLQAAWNKLPTPRA